METRYAKTLVKRYAKSREDMKKLEKETENLNFLLKSYLQELPERELEAGEWRAKVSTRTVSRLDEKALEEEFGDLSRFRKEVNYDSLTVHKI